MKKILAATSISLVVLGLIAGSSNAASTDAIAASVKSDLQIMRMRISLGDKQTLSECLDERFRQLEDAWYDHLSPCRKTKKGCGENYLSRSYTEEEKEEYIRTISMLDVEWQKRCMRATIPFKDEGINDLVMRSSKAGAIVGAACGPLPKSNDEVGECIKRLMDISRSISIEMLKGKR
jgi:hypothetical protein